MEVLWRRCSTPLTIAPQSAQAPHAEYGHERREDYGRRDDRSLGLVERPGERAP